MTSLTNTCYISGDQYNRLVTLSKSYMPSKQANNQQVISTGQFVAGLLAMCAYTAASMCMAACSMYMSRPGTIN